ncbi:MAG: PD-(D/E)XK nuclease family protein [Vagococcus sp.]|uniref:PD-(D/E)XK nuclease family protein n=1 Tax=Vagococcus sp. TaxID=1933889 RepID=UPI002FC9125C
MSIQFIIGPAGANHTKELIAQSNAWLEESAAHEVFYLVPNHVKFETEINVLNELSTLPRYKDWEHMVSMRLQVFSFSRLAWFFLQNTEKYQKQKLSDSGKYMVLRQVLIEIESELKLFKQEINKPGFVEQLIEIFDELQEGSVLSEDLGAALTLSGEGNVDEDLNVKFKDIQLIFDAYSKKLIELNCDGHDLLMSLSEFLINKELKNIMFVISGFTNFTAVEKQLIEQLMLVSGNFKIALVLDQKYTQKAPESLDLFFNTGVLYQELLFLAQSNGLPVLVDKKVDIESNQAMGVIDTVWQNAHKSVKKSVSIGKLDGALEIWQCSNPYTEVMSIAKKIRQLVTNEGYRYQDIVVLTRDVERYQQVAAPIFTANDIPFYINQEEKMKHHPLVDFIQSLFNMHQHFYQYRDVLRFLRSELFFPENVTIETTNSWEKQMSDFRQRIDYTENVVLAYGYSGVDWIKSKDWKYVNYHYDSEEVNNDSDQVIQEKSNSIRRLIKETIAPFFKKLEAVSLGKEASLLFYDFLIDAGVEKQLLFMRDQELSRGNLVKARNHEQTWQSLITLLDEYTELMGELAFDLDEFSQVLKTGLEGLSYSKVPTTIDQLVITSMDLVRAKKSKVTFIIGATDQELPRKIENKTLLTDEERAFLKETLPDDKFLKRDLTKDNAKEPFVFYLSLMSATDKMIISYPRNSEASKELKISPYLEVLKNQLRIEEKIFSQGFDLTKEVSLTDFSTDDVLLSQWVRFKRDLLDEKYPIPWLFTQLENRLLKKQEVKTKRLLSSLAHQNIPENLNQVSVEKLYGDTVYASVSKIENFYKCQYKYFLMYGLGLKERDQFELSPAATGDFYHESLDLFFKELVQRKLVLSQLSKGEIKELTQAVLVKVLGEDKFAILNTTNRMNYIKYQLEKTIQRVSWSLKRQSERSNMDVIQTEVLFGQALQEKGLDSLDFELMNQKKLKVRGKIDRIDQMKIDEDIYLSVIDYKSSKHNFDFVDAYYGLALQMITYLDVALKNAVNLVGEKAKAAGAFHMHVQNPVLTGSEKLTEESLDEEMLKAFKYDGLLIKEEKVLEKLDKTIDLGVKSSVYPYEQLKKGTMKSAKFVSETELDWLIENNQKKYNDAGEAIFNGETKLNPAFKGQTRIACEYCPFRSVCQFDVMLKENNYHRIDPIDKEEMMKMKPEENEDE